ncbi:MAG: ATP-binding protein [Malacoplasma sp.]
MVDSIEKTNFYIELKSREEEKFTAKIDDAYKICKEILSLVNHVFNNYSLHNEIHSLNIMEYMSNLITDITKIESLDIVLCVYAALFHDIGMVVYDDEIIKIKENKDPLIKYDFNVLMNEFRDENKALQEAVRPIHGKRVKVIINRNRKEFSNLFIIPGTSISFMDELIDICQAHNEDFEWINFKINEVIEKGKYCGNPKFVAILLRLADLLDIDEQRAPQFLYQLLKPSGISDDEWRQHFILDNFDKVKDNQNYNCKEIHFYGKCTDANIYRKFLQYIDNFKDELIRATSLSENFKKDIYVLKINPIPKLRFDTQGFSFADFKLSLDYNAVTNLLMGENIYGDKKYGLRELLQNSIDACKVYNEVYKKKPNPYETYDPQIRMIVDQDKGTVSIFDNGIGMSINILKNYFLNVGISYYKSKDYRFMGYNYKPIGNYGIGFLACFMLSQNVKIITKQSGENKANTIIIDRNSEYVCMSSEEIQFAHGTEIVLNYSEFKKVFKDLDEVKKFILKNFLLDEVSIFLNHIIMNDITKLKVDLRPLSAIISEKVSLSEYLKDIEIYADIKFSKSCFFESLKTLTGNDSYFYSDDDFMLHEETDTGFDLYDYLEDDYIKYLKVAIINSDESDEFNIALGILDGDYETALSKLNPYYITIVHKQSQEVSYANIESKDCVIEYYMYEDLCNDFNQASDASAYIFKNKQYLVSAGCNLFLGFEIEKKITESYNWDLTDEVFCKGVFVSNAHLTIPYILKDLKINKLVINSRHKDLIPNVTRNDFSDTIKNELSYAVGKAIHTWVLNNHQLDKEQKTLLTWFIKKYYSKNNRFYKDN